MEKWYDFLANQDNGNNFLFMNYGYHNSESELSLFKEDEVKQLPLKVTDIYRRVTT